MIVPLRQTLLEKILSCRSHDHRDGADHNGCNRYARPGFFWFVIRSLNCAAVLVRVWKCLIHCSWKHSDVVHVDSFRCVYGLQMKRSMYATTRAAAYVNTVTIFKMRFGVIIVTLKLGIHRQGGEFHRVRHCPACVRAKLLGGRGDRGCRTRARCSRSNPNRSARYTNTIRCDC